MEPRNPHVLYIIYHQGREYAWGAAKIGETVILGDRLGSIRFTDVKPFSGLQVKDDPGIPVVWSGFMIMAVGFFISLYSRRVQIWLLVTHREGTTRIGVAGRGGIIAMDSVYNKITASATVAQSKARR
ncbi:MAG: cytochrome c biogenesis protein ResB [Smithella sp.]